MIPLWQAIADEENEIQQFHKIFKKRSVLEGHSLKFLFCKNELQNYVQRVLALCDFWDLEKVALAKNHIRQFFT
jgi:hypothetical protein